MDKNKLSAISGLRYWFWWGLFFLLVAYGIHRYFEYRNQELDKRLEQLTR